MHKPFKKTHQNIRGWRRCTIQNSREERGFVFFWHDLTKKVDLKREVQRDNVLFLPFWFYILQYMWWMTNKTRVSSFKVWSRCWSGSLHRPSDRQTVVFGHDPAERHKACFFSTASGRLYGPLFFGGFLRILEEKFEFCCRNSSTNIRYTNENDNLKVDKVNWVFLLPFCVTMHDFMTGLLMTFSSSDPAPTWSDTL